VWHGGGQPAPERVCAEEQFVELFDAPGSDWVQAFTGIKAITVKNQEATTIGELMVKFFGNFAETGFQHEVSNQGMPEEGVMVADGKSDLCSVAGQFHDAADDFAAGWWPRPATTNAPPVDEVADEVQIVRLLTAEKVEQCFSLGVAKAKMQITQKQTANTSRRTW
jgi:hypothetical protein